MRRLHNDALIVSSIPIALHSSIAITTGMAAHFRAWTVVT